ncbi:MAG TPA: GntR family transcriptional regulator, partial [Lachnospiraceae bacterium]|nr:GntR family transcriptional regulator [Lachnospiraceae bacterium]
ARSQIIEFVDRMMLLGFQPDEILQLIEQVMKTMQKQ